MFSEGDTKVEISELQDSSQERFLFSNVLMALMTEGKTLVGGGGAGPQVAMSQIKKEKSCAKPKQLPAGPRKKWPLGRLFSSWP